MVYNFEENNTCFRAGGLPGGSDVSKVRLNMFTLVLHYIQLVANLCRVLQQDVILIDNRLVDCRESQSWVRFQAVTGRASCDGVWPLQTSRQNTCLMDVVMLK